MKCYVAAGFQYAEFAKSLMEELKKDGWEITYDWTQHGGSTVEERTMKNLGLWADNEMDGVAQADVVIVRLPGLKGTHFEMGYAAALGKPIVIGGDLGALYERCVFYHGTKTKIVICDSSDTIALCHGALKAWLYLQVTEQPQTKIYCSSQGCLKSLRQDKVAYAARVRTWRCAEHANSLLSIPAGAEVL